MISGYQSNKMDGTDISSTDIEAAVKELKLTPEGKFETALTDAGIEAALTTIADYLRSHSKVKGSNAIQLADKIDDLVEQTNFNYVL